MSCDHLDGKLFIDYLDSMDELIPVGSGRRRGIRGGREVPRVTDAPAAGRRRTIFLGSGSVRRASPCDASSQAPEVDLVGVVTAPRATRRPRRQASPVTPIAVAARELGIGTVLTPERLRSPDAIAAILAVEPELLVLADYGRLVPAPLLDLPPAAPEPAPVAAAAAPGRVSDTGHDPGR